MPTPISDIISKLLSKRAEDRYQGTLGLKRDLSYCLDQLQSKNTIDSFEIGQNDISNLFQIPQRLYGRDDEVKVLLNAFGRVSHGAKEIMLVAGYSGIGKSALVNEVTKTLPEKRGNFI